MAERDEKRTFGNTAVDALQVNLGRNQAIESIVTSWLISFIPCARRKAVSHTEGPYEKPLELICCFPVRMLSRTLFTSLHATKCRLCEDLLEKLLLALHSRTSCFSLPLGLSYRPCQSCIQACPLLALLFLLSTSHHFWSLMFSIIAHFQDSTVTPTIFTKWYHWDLEL